MKRRNIRLLLMVFVALMALVGCSEECPTAEEQEYINRMFALSADFDAAWQDMLYLDTFVVWGSPGINIAWMNELGKVSGEIKNYVNAVRSTQPPQSLREIHDGFIKGVGSLDRGLVSYDRALGRLDTHQRDQAYDLLALAIASLDRAGYQLIRYCDSK